jgi:pimeloyl-ACP methyl ester carboxylesterase
MATFVIVHGGWGGAWEWEGIAELLCRRSHVVSTPTLAGMGERSHLDIDTSIGLTTHIDDVVAAVENAQRPDVILCAHSYGGMPVTGALDRIGQLVKRAVYLDALVPSDGQSALDLLPDPFAELVRLAILQDGASVRIPIPPQLLPPRGLVDETTWDHYVERLRPQPAASFAEPIRLTGKAPPPATYVRFTGFAFDESLGQDPIALVAERVRKLGWDYMEVRGPHDAHLTNPQGLVELLHELSNEGPPS